MLENAEIREIKDIDIVEIDELWHYTKKQWKLWIWIAINSRTRKLIAFESGSRGKKALKRLILNIRHYLARFRRRSRCYSKSPAIGELSMWFLFEHDLMNISKSW